MRHAVDVGEPSLDCAAPPLLPLPSHTCTATSSGAGRTLSPSRWCRGASRASCCPCRAAASCCTRCALLWWSNVLCACGLNWCAAGKGLSLAKFFIDYIQCALLILPSPLSDPAYGGHGGGGCPRPPAAGTAGGLDGHPCPHEPAPGAALHPYAHGCTVQVGWEDRYGALALKWDGPWSTLSCSCMPMTPLRCSGQIQMELG